MYFGSSTAGAPPGPLYYVYFLSDVFIENLQGCVITALRPVAGAAVDGAEARASVVPRAVPGGDLDLPGSV